jgi:hypothetical protein
LQEQQAIISELEREQNEMVSTLSVVHDLCTELEVADVSTLSIVVLENKEWLQNAEKKREEQLVAKQAAGVSMEAELTRQLEELKEELEELQHLRGVAVAKFEDDELPEGHVEVRIDGVVATGKITGKVGICTFNYPFLHSSLLLNSCLLPFSFDEGGVPIIRPG